jgi:putative membrane protein
MKIKLNMMLMATMALSAAAFAQSPGKMPSSPAGASSPHQRDATNTSGTEVEPATDPFSAATANQQRVSQTPARSAADAQTFVRTAALSGMTEVELGKLALAKSSNAAIKQFADKMVTDHTNANMELKGIASGKGLEVPTSLDPDHAAMVKSMSAKSGKDFDSAYAKHMAADHDKAVALFQAESGDTDAELAAFSTRTLPTLQAHQQMAQRLASM